MTTKYNLIENNSHYFKNNNFKIISFITNSDREFNYNINSANIAYCNQIHSDNVLFITKPGKYHDSDGLITNCTNKVILRIHTADCVPISMFDYKQGLIGLIHSGWKGTYKGICLTALKIFINKGSITSDIKIYLGPSIKKCCYEVKNDVSDLFNKKYAININNKSFLDIESKIKDDLIFNGINPKNIQISNSCTYENKKYYSFRRDKSSKRMYTILGTI